MIKKEFIKILLFDVTNTNLYVFSIFDVENNKFSRVNDVVDFENRLNN